MSNVRQLRTSAVTQALHNSILARSHALGNSKKGLKEVASDLLNQFARHDKKAMSQLVDGTFLSRHTIERVMDCDPEHRVQADTLERIFRYFGAEINFHEVNITSKYQNKAKE